MWLSAGTIPWADSLQGQTTAGSTQKAAGVYSQGGRCRKEHHRLPGKLYVSFVHLKQNRIPES